MSEVQNSLSPFEAEHLVQSLVRHDISKYGSNAYVSKWLKQHEAIQRLNIQAHINAQNQNDEYITESFITFQQTSNLVYELLVSNAWKTKVLPLLINDLSCQQSFKSYFLIYHEAAVVNLLEIILFNKESCIQLGDALLDLVDYCAEKMKLLTVWEDVSKISKNAQDMLNTTDSERFLENKKDLDFGIAISALSIMRYITDNITDIPLNVMSRVLLFHEMACSCVYLIEKAPWLKRNSKKLCRFENGVWKDIPLDDLPKLCKIEAQLWLILYNILLEPQCRNKYDYNEHNKSIVLRLKQYMPNTLIDQLPILIDLKRYLEELTMIQVPNDPSLVKRGLAVEEIPDMTTSIMNNVDFKKLAASQRKELSEESPQVRQEIARSLASMYNMDDIETLLEDPKCSCCGNEATQRCSRCKNEWYCSRPCQVKSWKNHKQVCDMLTSN